MKKLEFPIIGTKTKASGPKGHRPGGEVAKKFDLESPEGRAEYFEAKVGDEIRHLKKYLDQNTFVGYLLGKKSSGKGTYSKLLMEIFGKDKIAHVSVGDLVREADDWDNFKKTKRYERLKQYYRGYVSFEDAEDALLGRSTSKLLPTEFILGLLKAHIDELKGKAIFIDGMPRNLDQVSYSLYFRDLIAYREDPDFFALIDIPESVIEERMKYRRVCPICNTSRNLKLFITSKIEYDEKDGQFYLICDNPDCKGARMVAKEGDEKGLEPIRERLDKDEELLRMTFKLHGVPKILLRNHVSVKEAEKHFDDYEITPEYVLKFDKRSKKVKVTEKPFVIKDDNSVESYSLLAPPVVVAFIKQMVEALDI
ncbi:nucleoside monophosphate kinase [Candidatus Woesebacteria bacterium]|nr:nucleoside monophosphate kinase [Candidatus Woesebacteria bacterium]